MLSAGRVKDNKQKARRKICELFVYNFLQHFDIGVNRTSKLVHVGSQDI